MIINPFSFSELSVGEANPFNLIISTNDISECPEELFTSNFIHKPTKIYIYINKIKRKKKEIWRYFLHNCWISVGLGYIYLTILLYMNNGLKTLSLIRQMREMTIVSKSANYNLKLEPRVDLYTKRGLLLCNC